MLKLPNVCYPCPRTLVTLDPGLYTRQQERDRVCILGQIKTSTVNYVPMRETRLATRCLFGGWLCRQAAHTVRLAGMAFQLQGRMVDFIELPEVLLDHLQDPSAFADLLVL